MYWVACTRTQDFHRRPIVFGHGLSTTKTNFHGLQNAKKVRMGRNVPKRWSPLDLSAQGPESNPGRLEPMESQVSMMMEPSKDDAGSPKVSTSVNRCLSVLSPLPRLSLRQNVQTQPQSASWCWRIRSRSPQRLPCRIFREVMFFWGEALHTQQFNCE